MSTLAKAIRIFNDFKTGYVRIRVCERCGHIGRDNHWSKNDTEKRGKIVYQHIWLCYQCFYRDIYGRI